LIVLLLLIAVIYKQKSHGIFPWLLMIDPESWEGLPCPRLILFQKKNTGGQTLSACHHQDRFFLYSLRFIVNLTLTGEFRNTNKKRMSSQNFLKP